jgi:uncharacterized protein
MIKRVVETTVVAVLVAGVVGAYFKVVGALPVAVTQTQKMSTFDVSGEGRVVVVPNEAMIMLGVSEQGRNLKQVQQSINTTMEDLSKQLKDLGIDSKDIKTTAYNYYPDYQDAGLYRAQASVAVTVRDLEQVSKAFDLVSALGLDSVSGPTFGLSDDLHEKSMREAREIAIGKARDKAEELAGIAGMSLGRIINISEGGMGSYPAPMYERDMAVVANPAELKVQTPVEVGSSEMVVNVTLSYETR